MTDWQPGDPLYPQEQDQQRCYTCGARWDDVGADVCPHCGSGNVSGCAEEPG